MDMSHPLGLKGVVVGEGASYEVALADAESAARFHIESFGTDAFDTEGDVQAAYVVQGDVALG